MLLHHDNTTAGVVDIYFDDEEVASIDMYGVLAWNVRTLRTGLVVEDSGLKALKFQIDGKDPSSSDFAGYMLYACLWRTDTGRATENIVCFEDQVVCFNNNVVYT